MRIYVPGVAAFDAVVARATAAAAELSVPGPAPVPLRFVHRRRATLVPPALTGRVDGTLYAVTAEHGGVREDLLHFLRLAVPLAAPPRAQRRGDVRVDVLRRAAIIPDGFRVGWLDGYVRNVSAGGVLLAGAAALDEGLRVRLRFELATEDDLLDVFGRIVRAEETGMRGLRLEGVADRDRERLVQFVFDRQRRALQARARAV